MAQCRALCHPFRLSVLVLCLRANSAWVNISNNRPLLIPLPPEFSYYSGLPLHHKLDHLTEVISLSELVVCTLMTSLHVASLGLTDTFHEESRLQSGVPYSVALPASKVKLGETTGACSFADGTCFDMSTTLIAWKAKKCAEWTVAFSASTFQLSSLVIQTGTISVFSDEGLVWGVQSGKGVFVYQPWLLTILFSKLVPSCLLLRGQADEYTHRQH